MKTISIDTDFSPFPAGRYRNDGPNSGERFRDDLLAPALRMEETQVLLDGAVGFGSSFLEEAFGGLVRVARFTHSDLASRLKLVTKDPHLRTEILRYIEEARAQS